MISLIPFEDTRVVGFELDGAIHAADAARIWTLIEKRLQQHPSLRIYCECRSLGGVPLSELLSRLPSRLRLARRIEREAVVGDQSWLSLCVGMGDRLFSSVQARHFACDRASEARAWILEGQRGYAPAQRDMFRRDRR